LDQELLRLSRAHDDSAGPVLGHTSSGRNLLFTARFASARAHLEQSIALYDPISHRSLIDRAGTHPVLSMRGFLGIVLFCLGFPEKARAECNAAMADARDLARRPSLGANLAVDSIYLMLVGDSRPLAEPADQLMAFTIEQGFPYWIAHASVLVVGGVKRHGMPHITCGTRRAAEAPPTSKCPRSCVTG
jgi:adenylate cyclase